MTTVGINKTSKYNFGQFLWQMMLGQSMKDLWEKKTAVAMSSLGSGASMGFHGLSCQLQNHLKTKGKDLQLSIELFFSGC